MRFRHRPATAVVVLLMMALGLLRFPGESHAAAGSGAVAEALAEVFANAVPHSNKQASVSTSAANPALLGSQTRIATSNLVQAKSTAMTAIDWEEQLQRAREFRLQHRGAEATRDLVRLIKSDAPEPLKRTALLELALIAEDEKDSAKALQIFGQFVTRWPEDSSVPEILLREGLIYRQMGLNNLALNKFYATMSAALVLKVDQFEYYRRLVLQAQTEVAETYYQQGKHKEAVEFLGRLLKSDNPALNRAQVIFKQVRSLSHLGQHEDVVAQGRAYLEKYTNSPEAAETRFLMAGSLKQLGRNADALQQIMVLLQEQEESATDRPEAWSYWQRRAGNGIANQLFQEGDYIHALQLYESLAELDPVPQWQLPVWYQVGLSYEHLEQPQKADETYNKILAREKDLGTNASPVLLNVISMARWRRDFLGWQTRSVEATQRFRKTGAALTNEVPGAPVPATVSQTTE